MHDQGGAGYGAAPGGGAAAFAGHELSEDRGADGDVDGDDRARQPVPSLRQRRISDSARETGRRPESMTWQNDDAAFSRQNGLKPAEQLVYALRELLSHPYTFYKLSIHK